MSRDLDGVWIRRMLARHKTEIDQKVETEADPIFVASEAYNFEAGDKSKLDGIEANATADQTGAEIKALYEAEEDTNAYTDADKAKLDGMTESLSGFPGYGPVNLDRDIWGPASWYLPSGIFEFDTDNFSNFGTRADNYWHRLHFGNQGNGYVHTFTNFDHIVGSQPADPTASYSALILLISNQWWLIFDQAKIDNAAWFVWAKG